MILHDPEIEAVSGGKVLSKEDLVKRAIDCTSRLKELDIAERIVIGSFPESSVRSDIISAIGSWRIAAKKRQTALIKAVLGAK